MKVDTYRQLHAFLLGAACIVVVLQYADLSRYHDRERRYSELSDAERADFGSMPSDLARHSRLIEKIRAISNERESDPWVFRNMGLICSGLILASVGLGWFERRAKRND